jgi:hypothetical protein
MAMKILLRAGIAVFSLGIGAAYAGDGDGHSATTLFTSIETRHAAAARTDAAQNNDPVVQADSTRPQDRGPWLFRVFSLP